MVLVEGNLQVPKQVIDEETSKSVTNILFLNVFFSTILSLYIVQFKLLPI